MGLFDRFRRNRARSEPTRLSTNTPPKSATAATITPATSPTPVSAACSLAHRLPRFAVVDVETTGLSAAAHRIVEIAVVTTDPWGRVLHEWSTRVNPQGPVGATHIHGITAADVADAPVFADIVDVLTTKLVGAAVAAHHANFDLAFLRAEYSRAGWDLPHLPALCTLEASEYYLPGLDRRRLIDCCWAIGAPLGGAHSALGDARATAALLAAYLHPQVGAHPLPQHLELPVTALDVRWPPGPSHPPSSIPTLLSSPRSRPDPSARAKLVIATQAATPPPLTLVELVQRFSLVDAMDEGAPEGTLAYLEKLAQVLEDGELTAEEAADLEAVADAEQLSGANLAAAHRAFVLALAHAALEDGKVSRAERAELQAVAGLLGVDQKVVPVVIERAEAARNQRLSANLQALPIGWAHGEPLRVGDKVVFSGCAEAERVYLEARSEELGVRIIGGVSAKTALLVTDGTMDGGKAVKAHELGTRTVHPDVYRVLLDHLQPALAPAVRQMPRLRVATAARHREDHQPLRIDGSPSVDSIASAGLNAVAENYAPNPALVRAWARANGYEVGTRGRLHHDIFAAYAREHIEGFSS